jgi:hypothetical protein
MDGEVLYCHTKGEIDTPRTLLRRIADYLNDTELALIF